MIENHWFAASELVAKLGLDERVSETVHQTFERWDGHGVPGNASGYDIALTARLVNFADAIEVFHHAGGVSAAIDVAQTRSGTQFDPMVAGAFCDNAESILSKLDEGVLESKTAAETPGFSHHLLGAELDTALAALGEFVDLKSPYTLGHSAAVSALASATAIELGLPDSDSTDLRRSGWLHDLGRLGVSNAVWDSPRPLSAAGREQVRLHPYLTERMLNYSPSLARYGQIAVLHHERLDGSGYPRGLKGHSISVQGRVLATADTYVSKIEPRPHRPALTREETISYLRSAVKNGLFEGDVVDATLVAAGHRVRRRPDRPAGLTPREIEVLRLLAGGSTGPEIATTLGISRKTVSSHIEHIYTKTGASNRAQASLFAVTSGLMNH